MVGHRQGVPTFGHVGVVLHQDQADTGANHGLGDPGFLPVGGISRMVFWELTWKKEVNFYVNYISW